MTDVSNRPAQSRTKAPTGSGRFVVRATVIHVVTYFVVGIVAAIAIDYASLFEQPVIRDYMRPFGSVSLLIGPVVQILRGVIFGLVLLPFREAIARRSGWLRLWLLLVGIGVLSTFAAAPSSIEGLVYTKVPLWYHAIGLPEMLVQSLLFSVLVALYLRYPKGVVAALPPVYTRILGALVVACLAFVGYALGSVAFAIVAGAEIDPNENLTLKVQGLFLIPFIANGVIAFVAGAAVRSGRRALSAGIISYLVGTAAMFAYQSIVTSSVDPLYALIAPLLPAIILTVLLLPRRTGPTAHDSVDASDRRL